MCEKRSGIVDSGLGLSAGDCFGLVDLVGFLGLVGLICALRPLCLGVCLGVHLAFRCFGLEALLQDFRLRVVADPDSKRCPMWCCPLTEAEIPTTE